MSDVIPSQTPSRRRFVGVAAATLATTSLSRLAFAETNQAITEVAQPTGSDKNAIRPLRLHVPESQLVELRRRVKATRWPERETVTDASQGVQLATMQKLARYWSTDYDWRKMRSEAERLAAIHHRDRWARHSFHPRSFETSECVADDRHARMARLDHRAVEDHRAADQSDGPWRKRIGRFRRRDSVAAGLRVFRQADHDRLGSRPHRTRVDRADEAPRIHAIRGARRRLGQCRHGADGPAGASGIARHSHQHAGHRSGRHRTRRSSSATRRRPVFRPTRSTRTSSSTIFYKHGLGYASEMANRPQTLYGIEDSPVGLAAWMLDHDAASDALIARVFDGQPEGLTRDDVLDNVTLYWLTNTADLVGASVLGKQAGVLCAEERHDSGRRERLSRRALRSPAELGGAGVSQADPLQPARQRRSLRGVGAAATFHG